MSKIKIHNVRPFIYRERESIESFLEESQLWKDIYEVFLKVKDNAYYLKVPSVKMFNEVRYQCVRLMLDKHPEENLYVNYLNNARDTLGWRYASDLCFSMVYAVMSLIKNPPEQATHFCTILSENRLKGEQWYFPHFRQFIEETKAVGGQYEIDLSPMPESPKVMRNTGYFGTKTTSLGMMPESAWVQTYDNGWWKRQTLDFDSDAIQEIIALWSDPQEKQEITQRIDAAKAFYAESILSHQRVLDLFSGLGGLDVKNLKIQSLISSIESIIKEKDSEIQDIRAQKRTMEKEISDLKAELEKQRKEITYLKYGYDEDEFIPSYEPDPPVPPEILAQWAEEAAYDAKYAAYEGDITDDVPDWVQLLQESQQREAELKEALEQERKQKAEKEGEERLPMDAFITYAEKHYPADQNKSAKILKEALGDVYNIRRVDDETYERWKLLGTKESFDDRMAESMKRIAERPTMKDNNGIVAGGDFTAKITPTDAQMNMLADKLVQTTETKNLTK